MATHGENPFKLQALTPKHAQVASLLAQGLGPSDVAALVDFTPQYITMLTRDPLFKEELKNMAAVVDARMEAMYGLVANVVADGMMNGSVDERIKAARLQLEVTGRIGKNDRPAVTMESSMERLSILAERLLALQPGAQHPHQGDVIDVEEVAVQDELPEGQFPAQRDHPEGQRQLQGSQSGGNFPPFQPVRANGQSSD